jgi:hypothetical protein
MIMSAQTHKEGALKPIKKPMQKSGKAKSGEKPKPYSSVRTHYVTGAELNLAFPIIRITKFTESRSILTYQALWPTVMIATAVHTTESFNALFASNFAQKQKVKDAILALTLAISDELKTIEIPETKSRIGPGGSSTSKPTLPRKSLTPKPGNG